MSKELDLIIISGTTFSQKVRWEAEPIVYAPITGITKAAQVVITSPNHGIVNGWPVLPVSVVGMVEINPPKLPILESYWKKATVLSANTVALNEVNASLFTTYTSGGYLQYNTPHDLTDYTAEMIVEDKPGGVQLDIFSTANGKIVIDLVNFVIQILIEDTVTPVLTWTKGVYNLKMTSPPDIGSVTTTSLLLCGKIKVEECT